MQQPRAGEPVSAFERRGLKASLNAKAVMVNSLSLSLSLSLTHTHTRIFFLSPLSWIIAVSLLSVSLRLKVKGLSNTQHSIAHEREERKKRER